MGTTNSQADEESIRQLVEETWPRSFDAGDAAALAALFVEDADFVTANAYWWRGREEVEKGLDVVMRGPFRGSDSRQRVEKIRFLSADIAVVHVWLEFAHDEEVRRQDRGTRVMVKQGGEWRYVAVHNSPVATPPAEIADRLPGTQQSTAD